MLIVMKKYLLTGWIWLLVVLAIAYFMFSQNKLSLPDAGFIEWISSSNNMAVDKNLLELIPADLEQMMYMNVDPGLISVLESSQQQNPYASGFWEALALVDELAAVQYMTASGAYSALFVATDNDESLEKIQEIGLVVGWAEYKQKKIAKNVWLYGDSISIEYIWWLEWMKLVDDDRWTSLIDQLDDGKYNMGFVSTPSMVNSPNPLVQQFASQLRYTVALSHLSPDDTYGEIILQFADGVVKSVGDTFDPVLAQYAPEDSILFLEMRDLLWVFAIGRQQFTMLAPIVLGQFKQSLWALLSTEDYNTLYDVLSDHISLVIAPQENMFGMSVQLNFAHPESLALMEKLQAFWGDIASSALGSGSVTTVNKEEWFAFEVVWLPMFGSDPVLSLDKLWDGSTISILGSAWDSGGIDWLSYSDKTAISFFVNWAALTEKFQWFGSMISGVEWIKNTDYIQWQSFKWDIQLWPVEWQIRVWFSVIQ